MLRKYKSGVRTLTVNNGKEFTRHKDLADELGAQVCFANPKIKGISIT